MADNGYQLDLFNSVRPYFKIDKPIRLIELFAGIGAQAKALEILGVPFEHWKICEWAANSIKSYNAIHIKDFIDYSKGKTKEELVEFLDGNISTNYNDPCNVAKKNEEWLRDIYNNCIATHNLMNIMKVSGKDLEIVDTDKYCYIMTYSFPCQDLSLAGKRQGMAISQAEGGTRSGLLWEVERILDELTERPQVLLMENVPEVIGAGNVKHFNKWLDKLESLGYTNHFQILNAKDYGGIPQNRRRVFMVSILGDYAYDFPIKIKLKYRLKDFLEKKVDEKYYLSEKMIQYISATGTKDFSVNNSQINCSNARPLTTEQNKRAGTTNYIADGLEDNFDLRLVGSTNGHQSGNIYDDNGTAPTLTACDYKSPPKVLEDKSNNSSEQSDKIEHIANLNYYSHEQSDRVYGTQGCAPTLSTKGEDNARGIKVVDESRERERNYGQRKHKTRL